MSDDLVVLIRNRLKVLEDRMFDLRVKKDFNSREFWTIDGGIKELKFILVSFSCG